LNHRYFLHLSFNGGSFHGWQSQHNAPSVQSTLREALSVVLRKPVEITGAGRTDAGVHAREFYAHFDLQEELQISERMNLVHHLNGYLPDAVAVKEVTSGKGRCTCEIQRPFPNLSVFHFDTKKDPFSTRHIPGSIREIWILNV
jgi:tRNA pseudouridine38-40 synthase